MISESYQPRHRVGARAIHADLTVMIDRHERKGWVDPWIDHLDIELVDAVDRLPVMDGGAPERIDAELEPGATDRLNIDDVAQIVDVGKDEIFLMRRVGL